MDKRFLTAAFLEGFLLVAIELVYVQLLHPYYGDSYFAWLSMLAITMAASGGGYFLGSIISRKTDQFAKFYTIGALFFLTLMFGFIYSISEKTFMLVAEMSFLPSLFTHTSIVLFLPVMLITSFSPLIVKYHARDEAGAGKAAGRIFFTSTVGGVIAVYGVAFLLLPFVDLLKLLNTITMLVFVINIGVLFNFKNLKLVALESVMMIFILLIAFKTQEMKMEGKNTKVIVRQYGIMGEIEVREEFGKQRFISLNRTTQSAIEISTGLSSWSYPYRVSTYASLAPPKSDVLVAGLGGGVLVNQLAHLDFSVTCVEFDARMVKLARKYMNLNPDVKIKIDDFRHYINATSRKYDLIILDLSKGETMPGNVYSVESFRQMMKLLKPEGFIELHYFSNVYGKGEFGLHSIMKTMERAGYFFSLVKKNEGDTAPEEIILASAHPEIIPNIKFRMPDAVIQKFNFPVVDFFNKNRDFSNGIVLYDDKNSMEKVQLEIVADIREKLRRNERVTFFENSNKK